MSRLFVNIIKRVTEKEDAFTECLAETLRGDPVLARDFLLQVCGEDVEAVSVARAEIQIETQKEFPGACLDMLFWLDGKSTVGFENKLWSPESEGQLSKYLRLGLNRMAFITDYYAPVEDEVLQDPHYRAPQNGRHHFVWSDFYSVVETSAKKNAAPFLNRALLELFKHLGFEPPHPQIGDLLHPDPGIQKIKSRKLCEALGAHSARSPETRLEKHWTELCRGTLCSERHREESGVGLDRSNMGRTESPANSARGCQSE